MLFLCFVIALLFLMGLSCLGQRPWLWGLGFLLLEAFFSNVSVLLAIIALDSLLIFLFPPLFRNLALGGKGGCRPPGPSRLGFPSSCTLICSSSGSASICQALLLSAKVSMVFGSQGGWYCGLKGLKSLTPHFCSLWCLEWIHSTWCARAASFHSA